MTRNSRYQKADSKNQLGLLPSSLVPVLTHLLVYVSLFRKLFEENIKTMG